MYQLEDKMFEHTDALIVAAELKAVFGRAILIGLLFLAGFKYIKAGLDDLHKM